jgi:hypothetical protein
VAAAGARVKGGGGSSEGLADDGVVFGEVLSHGFLGCLTGFGGGIHGARLDAVAREEGGPQIGGGKEAFFEEGLLEGAVPLGAHGFDEGQKPGVIGLDVHSAGFDEALG